MIFKDASEIIGLSELRIVIADKHPVYRQLLRRSIAENWATAVLGEASDAISAIRIAMKLKPDILLIDLELSPHLALENLARDLPETRLVFMVSAVDGRQIAAAFRLGAHGILFKPADSETLLKNIQNLLRGRYWLGSERGTILVEALREVVTDYSVVAPPERYSLTARELDIIHKIVQGRSNKQVGEEFCISERTVKHHITNIFRKLGVVSRVELAMFAVNHKLVCKRGGDGKPVKRSLPLSEEGRSDEKSGQIRC